MWITLIHLVEKFPKKFCATDNVLVIITARDILPNVGKYVQNAKQNKTVPHCNNFKIVESTVYDKSLPAKLAFFESFMVEFEPFLRTFQSNDLLVPFRIKICCCFCIMQKFIKSKILNITVLDVKDKTNLLMPQKIKIEFAQNALNVVKNVIILKKVQFREACHHVIKL